jgi:hypothetical protein
MSVQSVHPRATSFGGVIAAAGGVLTELAYLLMPVSTVPIIGSITAPTLADEAPSAAFSLLYVVPVAAGITVCIGVWLRLAERATRAARIATGGILLCSLMAALAYIVPLNEVNSEIEDSWASVLGIDASDVTGTGFWVALMGIAIASVGAIIGFAGARTQRHH